MLDLVMELARERKQSSADRREGADQMKGGVRTRGDANQEK
jgi:hypothetical protein